MSHCDIGKFIFFALSLITDFMNCRQKKLEHFFFLHFRNIFFPKQIEMLITWFHNCFHWFHNHFWDDFNRSIIFDLKKILFISCVGLSVCQIRNVSCVRSKIDCALIFNHTQNQEWGYERRTSFVCIYPHERKQASKQAHKPMHTKQIHESTETKASEQCRV